MSFFNFNTYNHYMYSHAFVTPNTHNCHGLIKTVQYNVAGYDNTCLSKMSYEQAYTSQGGRENLTKTASMLA